MRAFCQSSDSPLARAQENLVNSFVWYAKLRLLDALSLRTYCLRLRQEPLNSEETRMTTLNRAALNDSETQKMSAKRPLSALNLHLNSHP